MKALNVIHQTTVDRAKSAAADLVSLATPRGHLAECKQRAEVSRRAKCLLTAIAKLKAKFARRK